MELANLPPVFREFRFQQPTETERFFVNFMGTKMRKHYKPPSQIYGIQHLQPSEDLLEWADLLSAVLSAKDTFRMMDLGAGFGRWLVNGAHAARQKGLRPFVIGIEAEDTHHAWMLEHFRDNDVCDAEFVTFNAPVSDTERDVFFTVGRPTEWYGQSILPAADYDFGDYPDAHAVSQRAIAARNLIERYGPFDTIHADIQGEEAQVFASCIDSLNRLAKRVHIGTHSPEIDAALADLFRSSGWHPGFIYPSATSGVSTPFGIIDFQDGIQSWVNPALLTEW